MTRNGIHRVVITGAGMITPLGHNVHDSWSGVLAGRSGYGPVTLFDPTDHTIHGMFEVKNFDPAEVLGRREARRRDRYQQFATIAANEAMAQSGLEVTDANRGKIGVFIGTGIGGIMTLLEQEHKRQEDGARRLSPFGITMIMPNGAAGMLAIDFGLHGPSSTISTACASGLDAIGHAFHAVRRGEVIAMLTGGSECMLTPVAVGGFEAARATSTKTDHTPQPFDRNRDGLLPGEGAAMMVIESLEHAQSRGAHILAEIVGYGQTTDAYHITAPAEGGEGAARAMKIALIDAGVNTEDVDYISAHGTATELNDRYETMAIKNALGADAYHPGISSTKAMTGHIMGATGAIEAVFCVKAAQDQVMPPNINYDTPDPDCDLNIVANEARPGKVKVTMNNAFGFGGHNAVVITKSFDD